MQDPIAEGNDMLANSVSVELPIEEDVVEETDILNASDRCDSCNSQAYVWINGVSGDLLFCGHHFAKNEVRLRTYAFEIVDERYKLDTKRESGANS